MTEILLPGEEKDFQPDLCDCGYQIEDFFDWTDMTDKKRCKHPFNPHTIE